MHGHGGKKDEVRSIFPLCLGLGYAAFSIDAQYHGERVNSGTEIFSQYIHRNRDAVIQTVVDARRGLDYLETRPDIDPARLGLIGGSMGGIMGSIFAGVDERLKAPILIVAGGDFGLMSRMSHLSSLEALRQKVSLPYDEIGPIMQPCEPLNFVGLISPRPVLFLNGLHDDIVPPEATKELFQAAGEPKEIHWYDAGHGLPREEIAARMIPWLEQNLSP
jgi:dipeptidyl aminopeptidase/acylaminoacyl peptidase